MSISHAGHLPAVQFNAAGATILPLQGDRLLGISRRARTVHMVQLQQNDTVVLYSDGLIESRGEDIDGGLSRLHDSSLMIVGSDIENVAEVLAHQLADPTNDDDVTVLVLRLT